MITLSNIAKKQLINLVKFKEGKALLLYIKGGGCNGFNYQFDILKNESKINKYSEIIKLDSYNLYLCDKSLMFLLGTNIDYIEDIMGSRFDFKNDKIISSCGCGTSVNFKLD